MTKIKGFRIRKGEPIPVDVLKEANVKLPFKADNWKSTYGSELVEPTGLVSEEKEEPKEESEPIVEIKKKRKKRQGKKKV